MWKQIFAILFYLGCAATEKSRVCYYRNKSYDGKGAAKLVPEQIDPFLCTEINYAFLKINSKTMALEMTLKNDADIIARLNHLKMKNPALKVIAAVGGWNHENKPLFSNMAHTKETRTKFINSLAAFLQTHNLDGVSYDWMYPATRPKNTRSSDRASFVDLLKETHDKFRDVSYTTRKPRYTISAQVATSRSRIAAGYQIDEMAKYVDRVDVMTHSLWGHWKKTTGSHTAMPSVKNVIKAWIKGGMPAQKINLVLSAFGRSFNLSDASNNGLSAPIVGAGNAGTYTGSSGILAYYEICSTRWSQVTSWSDSKTKTPYASHGNLWVGYDDAESIKYKVAEVVMKMDLNGFTFWALDWDDFSGSMCHMGSFPLLNEATKALTPPADCSTDPCKNGGECFMNEHVEGYSCECKPGFTGPTCEAIDYCVGTPCLHNGNCTNKEDRFECKCAKGYTGNSCQECVKDHTICKLFDDPDYYCAHKWMKDNCKEYCGMCKQTEELESTDQSEYGIWN